MIVCTSLITFWRQIGKREQSLHRYHVCFQVHTPTDGHIKLASNLDSHLESYRCQCQVFGTAAILRLKEHSDGREAHRDQKGLKVDPEAGPPVATTRGDMGTCLVVCVPVEQVQEVVSLGEAAQSWEAVDRVLNQRVYWGHKREFEPDRVPSHAKAALADVKEVADGDRSDDNKPWTDVNHRRYRYNALYRVLPTKTKIWSRNSTTKNHR